MLPSAYTFINEGLLQSDNSLQMIKHHLIWKKKIY